MGYIKLDRKIMESFLWTDKPFAYGQAWVDLLMLANWKDTKELYQGQLRNRKRGTVSCSKKWLADRWGWDRKKVTKFLAILQRDEMVTTDGTTHGTTITIENWGKYQGQGTTNGTTDGTTDGQPLPSHSPAIPHTIRKEKKEKESIKKAEEERALDELRKQRDEVLKKWEA